MELNEIENQDSLLLANTIFGLMSSFYHAAFFERQVRWDYTMSRRQTEMWYYEEWVFARMGKRPQLLPPAALA
ncbi:hypothetical protein [Bacillus clarus]|uniref:Uncharacterized protein n=1 Tax=Bacillus clarus TaxID=2338372 RepID=A0A090YMJ1_9BACI|nr:hypothetical protein DJ93_306 [Bacillus clarus]